MWNAHSTNVQASATFKAENMYPFIYTSMATSFSIPHPQQRNNNLTNESRISVGTILPSLLQKKYIYNAPIHARIKH